ncbi:MAG: hypothetical protein DHS20C18_41200 [Saprospiraceae bacterium]|nr:MAG: hypothetical protein DHS20C18_41200 [Saprospiraceae bacterium]
MTKQEGTKQGYKKTKLGWIPIAWNVVKITDVAIVGNGTTPSRKVNEYWKNGSIPWLPTGKVNEKEIYFADEFITPKALEETSLKILPIDTVLVGMIGQGKTRGMAAIMKLEATVNQNFAYIVSKDGLCSKFLFNKLTYDYKILRGAGRGGGQESLNCSIVKNYKIPLPPLPEQQKIATILSTWDQAIDKLGQLIAAKEQQQKGLMQRLLTGKVRLPDFDDEWKEVKINEVAERITRRNDKLNDTVVTISAQRGFVRQEEFFNKRVASKILSNYYLIKRGEFGYNKSYSNGYPMGAFKRLDEYEYGVVTTLYICFKIKKRQANSDFLLKYFEAGLMVQGLMKIAHEGGRAHGLLNIGISDFFDLKLVVPILKEQTAIAAILNKVDQETELLNQKKESLKQQKKGLMQQLLTGKVRVKP